MQADDIQVGVAYAIRYEFARDVVVPNYARRVTNITTTFAGHKRVHWVRVGPGCQTSRNEGWSGGSCLLDYFAAKAAYELTDTQIRELEHVQPVD